MALLELSIAAAFTALLIYVFGKVSELEGATAGYAFTVYPWFTTFPETISTTYYAVRGLYTTAMVNSVFSAIFDMFAAFGLSTLVHGESKFHNRDLGLLAVLAALLFIVLDFDGVVTRADGVVIYAYLAAAMAYSVIKYGSGLRRVGGFDVVRIGVGLLGLAVSGYLLGVIVDKMVPYIGQAIGGLISAVATSVPDLVVALIYGVRSEVSQAEILGCILHDFGENMGTAALVAGMLVDGSPLLTVAIVSATVATLMVIMSYGRVTRFEAVLATLAFIICSVILFFF